ncbi:unnamed protein product [Ophioblennius macclurei]
MTLSWKLWITFFHIALSFLTGVMLQDFNLEPMNPTVLQGSTVQFNATVRGVWKTMTWTAGNLLVLTITSENDTTSSSDQFSATLFSNDSVSRVEFSIYGVTREQAGPVECTILGALGTRTAQLEVQESGTVLIVGGNRTADQGDQAEFKCEAVAWFPEPSFTWTRNGNALDPKLYTTANGTLQGGIYNSTSVLKFQAESSTTVQCLVTVPALTRPMSSSVYLEVFPDWTVLIAVVVSIGGFALLVLLIILIIFCYRRRKASKLTYNDEMMRARTQSQVSGVGAPGRRQGTVNMTYVQDGQTSVTSSDFTDNDFPHMKSVFHLEMPDTVDNIHVGNFPKHRHVTIV